MRTSIIVAVLLLTACAKDTIVRLQVRITGDERKDPLRNPGSADKPASDVEVLTFEAFNPASGETHSTKATNDWTISDEIKLDALDVSPGPGWMATLTGTDRYGYLFSIGRSVPFEVPKTGEVTASLVFGIADDFATSAKVKGGIGPFASANALPDGTVLMVGLAGAKLHEPLTGRVCADDCLTGDLPPGRAMHVAVTLSDGRVFIAGGRNSAGNALSDAFVFDPSSKAFSKVAVTGLPARAGSAAAVLQDDKVLIAGGIGATAEDSKKVVVVSPEGGAATVATELARPVSFAAATRLDSGEVLVTGGLEPGTTPVAVANAYIYSASGATGRAITAPMLRARWGHTATRLADGAVFIFGGRGAAGATIAAPEVFATSKFLDAEDVRTTLDPRVGHTAVRLENDAVLIVGGNDDPTGPPDPGRLVSAVYVVPGVQPTGVVTSYLVTYSNRGQLVARTGAAAVLLPDASVLIAGGVRPSLSATPTALPPSADWTESLDIFVPCGTKAVACKR